MNQWYVSYRGKVAHGGAEGAEKMTGIEQDGRLFRRADAGEMLEAVGDDFAAEAVALDVEQAGCIGLVAAGDFQHASDEEALSVGEAWNGIGFKRGVGPGIFLSRNAYGVAN